MHGLSARTLQKMLLEKKETRRIKQMLQLIGVSIKIFHYLSELRRKKREDLLKNRHENEPTIVFKHAPWEKDVVLVYVIPARSERI